MRKTLKAVGVVVLSMVLAAGMMMFSGCDGMDFQGQIDAKIISSPSATTPGLSDNQAGKNWTMREVSTDFRSVAWSGTLYVAVGGGDAVLTSTDGESWTPRSIRLTKYGDKRLVSIVWTGTQFVAVGSAYNNGTKSLIVTSPDGITWTERGPATANILFSVAISGTRHVIVGNHIILTSSDGVKWTSQPAGSSQVLCSVVWSGTQFAAVGIDGAVLTSPDGESWTSRNIGYNASLFAVAWSGSQLVAVGNERGNGVSLTSPDGIAWTLHTTNIMLQSICWSGTQFVAAGDSSIYSSPDGMTWTKRHDLAIDKCGARGFHGVVWINKRFMAAGGGIIASSLDGSTWSVQTPPSGMQSIAWSGKLFATAGYCGSVYTSPDGETWTPQTSGTSKHLHGIIWSGTQFVAVGGDASGSVIQTSSDGISWITRTAGASSGYGLNAVVWSGARFAAVGDDGTVLTSPDGITWSSQPSGVTDTLFGVAWSGEQFVAVGSRCVEQGDTPIDVAPALPSMKEGYGCRRAADIVLTSIDGATWTTHVLDSDNAIRKITWAGTQFAAVGYGPILTSPDGVAWTSRYAGADLADVIWTGKQLISAGGRGAIYTSSDGVNWTEQDSGTTATLTGLAWSGTQFVAVGSGVILTSP